VVLVKASCKTSENLVYPINIGSNNYLFNYLPMDRFFTQTKDQINVRRGINGENGLAWVDQKGLFHRLPEIVDKNILSYSF
jgi:hypothetical protein